MNFIVRFMAGLVLSVWATAAIAQGTSWVQVEARPSEAQARERAEFYAGGLADVQGYRLASGWYAIALGPYSEAEAGTVPRRAQKTLQTAQRFNLTLAKPL